MTILSQIGGVIYLTVILICNKKKKKYRLRRLGLFSGIYLLSTFVVVPLLAKIGGRERIKNTEFVKAHSFYTILLNRNYVKSELNEAMQNIGDRLNKEGNGIQLVYLDANFPFINGFPLLPHLSHSDGKKVDVSLIYQNENGEITNKKPSISGYGVYADPAINEYSATKFCKKQGHWQYDFTKYLTLGRINRNIEFSEKGTRSLLKAIVQQPKIGKIFIEPHLKTRLEVRSKKIRFHGCIAVRHDDHIHCQL
ncbi:MAG: hypothetical protein HC831_14840 [Chloroflexia bacterium]|nr:hypothetical protein [Chloroflexia bacterium]